MLNFLTLDINTKNVMHFQLQNYLPIFRDFNVLPYTVCRQR